tara:strand:+ start:547 stop:1140 length:594 start_codon:yes stop_codon:yes gene_type:complete
MKNIIDFIISLLALLLLSPLLVTLGLIILIIFGSPILFVQVRPGHRKIPFKFFKFRTMTDAKNSEGNLLPDENRLTSLGLFLRKTSLDELPSLWNVLKGDMSLIGPRPLLMEYLPLYSKKQMRRHEVKPGITGWAQINGRNAISWEEKFELDIWYVDNHSFWLDLKILLLTIWKVINREGVSHQKFATMPKFKRSKQ